MTRICLYFKVHQPYRLKVYKPIDIEVDHCYANPEADKEALDIACDKCYLPANEILLDLIRYNPGKFAISFSMSGTIVELLLKYRPDVIQSFQRLTASGQVEILGETYFHSLSSLHSEKEFRRQVMDHQTLIKKIFSVETKVFRNTELIHNDHLAGLVAGWGFRGILCEGIDRILSGRSPNKVYRIPGGIPGCILLRNSRLSDDIAFRFDDHSWEEFPLTATKFAEWIHAHENNDDVLSLFFDYETFGVHKGPESGIFDFLRDLPAHVLKMPGFYFATPSQVLDSVEAIDEYQVVRTISWKDRPEESCVWSQNMEQHNTLKKIYSLEKMVTDTGDFKTIHKWGRLQSADHFYYMADNTGNGSSGKYRNPFFSPKQAFQNYVNILADFEISLIRQSLTQVKKRAAFHPRVMSFL
jgi:alpha-amylase